MSKLGYTWYPKDWGNSDAVFELLLHERGMFRELIDMAMLNDNKTEIKTSLWCRKFAIKEDELEAILTTLEGLGLIEINDNNLFIPSCEKRLSLVRRGSKGGKKSKPNEKPTTKPNKKPNTNQIEKKEKRKELENNIPSKDLFISHALSKKSNLCQESISLKYDAWIENSWKDGNDKPIKNWKSKLINTIPYLKVIETPKYSGPRSQPLN